MEERCALLLLLFPLAAWVLGSNDDGYFNIGFIRGGYDVR